jgi:kynurenine formamidase
MSWAANSPLSHPRQGRVDRKEHAMCTEEGFPSPHRSTPPCAEPRSAAAPSVSRRAAILGGAVAATSAALGGTAHPAPAAAAPPAAALPAAALPAAAGGRRALRDLTYPLTTSFPAFSPGEEAVRRTVAAIEPDGYYMQEWRIIEHIGTHVDAPGHFTAGGRLAPQLDLSELVVPAVVIDIAGRAARNPDAVVTVDDVRAFERRYGRIPRDAAVLMHSGWGARVGDAAAYRGTDATGTLHFPGFSPDACEWLLRHRAIRCLGVDTLSIDAGNSTTFDTHVVLSRADRYGLENLANLGRIPRHGATIVVGLIPYEQGSGGQARVFATW